MPIRKMSAIVIMVTIMTQFPIIAYIYQARVISIGDEKRGNKLCFIGGSDFHDKENPANEKQRIFIESYLKNLNPKKNKVIVEDLCSANSQGSAGCGNFTISSHNGVLAGMGDFCRKHHIPLENVEYRYCRVASMGPVINNLQASPHLFPSTRSIEVKNLIQEINNTISVIGVQIDNSLSQLKNEYKEKVKKAYKEEVKKVRSILDALKLTKHKSVSIADYLHATCTKKNKIDILKHLLTFDSGLLDIKMACCIMSSREQRIIGFAGGTHINKVCELLKKMGWKEEMSTKVIYKKESDTNKCLGSTMLDGNFCLKPEPLPLQELKKYITYKE